MTDKRYRLLELFLLFVLLPVSFLWSYPVRTKVTLAVVGFVYVLALLFRAKLLKPHWPSRSIWKAFLKAVAWKFLILVLITIPYVYLVASEKLFKVLLEKPLLWLGIICVYTFLSVWPQELIYRRFFFERYRMLFSNTFLFLLLNALVFALAHVFFKNILVLVLTFIGGLLFAYTYHKRPSVVLVSAEHALYGNWLFTLGMGDMLAFPS